MHTITRSTGNAERPLQRSLPVCAQETKVTHSEDKQCHVKISLMLCKPTIHVNATFYQTPPKNPHQSLQTNKQTREKSQRSSTATIEPANQTPLTHLETHPMTPLEVTSGEANRPLVLDHAQRGRLTALAARACRHRLNDRPGPAGASLEGSSADAVPVALCGAWTGKSAGRGRGAGCWRCGSGLRRRCGGGWRRRGGGRGGGCGRDDDGSGGDRGGYGSGGDRGGSGSGVCGLGRG